jgi:hypothetical protein
MFQGLTFHVVQLLTTKVPVVNLDVILTTIYRGCNVKFLKMELNATGVYRSENSKVNNKN